MEQLEQARIAAAEQRDKELAEELDAKMVEDGLEKPEDGARRAYGLVFPKPQPEPLGEIQNEDGGEGGEDEQEEGALGDAQDPEN